MDTSAVREREREREGGREGGRGPHGHVERERERESCEREREIEREWGREGGREDLMDTSWIQAAAVWLKWSAYIVSHHTCS